jgi:hypothetical protein
VTADFAIAQPVQVELHWNTTSQVIEFLVKPMTVGTHKAQVQLWARRKLRGAVVVHAEATPGKGADALNAHDLEIVATVEVKFTVFGHHQSFKQSQEQSPKHRETPGHGHSIEM